MVEAYGAGQGPVYELYCPMAFGNQGATWLQSDPQVDNPYFGASMLRCGEVKRQLKDE
jgi:Cu(I)/Ag(I) efflux system membrane fusion protein